MINKTHAEAGRFFVVFFSNGKRHEIHLKRIKICGMEEGRVTTL